MDHDGPPIIPIRPIFSDPPSFRCPIPCQLAGLAAQKNFARRAKILTISSTKPQRVDPANAEPTGQENDQPG
jgi:hypothetical protein